MLSMHKHNMHVERRCPQRTALVLGILVVELTGLHGARIGVLQTELNNYPNSHMFGLEKVSNELVARGHEVVVIAPQVMLPFLTEAENKALEVYENSTHGLTPEARAIWMPRTLTWHPSVIKYIISEAQANGCDGILANATLQKRLKDYNFDIFIHESISSCGPTIAYRLNLSTVALSGAPIPDPFHSPIWLDNPWHFDVSNPISIMPQMGNHFSNRMTFVQRMYNSGVWLLNSLLDEFFTRQTWSKLYKKHGIDWNAPGARERGQLVLYNDDFALTWPRPLLPNVKFVGPILATDAQPLAPQFEEWVTGDERGCVIVSTGTLIKISPTTRDAVGRALSRLPVRVLWKLSEDEIGTNKTWMQSLAPSVKVVTWLPQNDLLGHPSVKAFLTHGGMNSLQEAAWHGVPIAGTAGFGDQADNVAKAHFQGWAVPLPSVVRVKEEQVYSALLRLLTEPSFTEAAQRMKTALRSRKRTGLQQAADWVEYAIDTDGAKHLLTPRNEMSYYAYHSIDVGVVWATLIALLLLLVALLLRLFWSVLYTLAKLIVPTKQKQH